MEELPKRRKTAKKAEKPKRERAAEIRSRAANFSANAESLFKFAARPLVLFTVYIIASLYTPYTGNFGAHIAAFLLSQTVRRGLYSAAPIRASSSVTQRSNSFSADATASGRDRSTPAIFSSSIG